MEQWLIEYKPTPVSRNTVVVIHFHPVGITNNQAKRKSTFCLRQNGLTAARVVNLVKA